MSRARKIPLDPKPSTDISFTQAGTGAVARTVDSKMKDLISVKDFGATGNGTTDDTAAVQAAINAARAVRGALYFPPNNVASTYRITEPLTCDGPISIIGVGPQSVTIMATGFTAGQYILDFNLADGSNYFFDIRGITLRSNNGLPNGLRLRNTSYCTIQNVQIYNVANGVDVSGTICFSNFFDNLVLYQISGNGFKFTSFTGGGQYKFSNCTFTGDIGFVVDSLSALDSLAFTCCNFEQCVTSSFITYGTVRGLSFIGCRTEGVDGVRDFLINPAIGKEVCGVTILGCDFASDTVATVPITLGGTGGKVRGFHICGNNVGYAGLSNFVTLNGEGESGLIAGNYFSQPATTPTNGRRDGVVVYSNENASGKCAESWGNASFTLEEGSFTPGWQGTTIAGDTVPRNSLGRYRRSGNMVTVWIWGDYLLDSYTTKPTGQVRITNLPFAAAADFNLLEFPVTSTRITHSLPVFGRISPNATSILLWQESSASTSDPTALDWTAVRDPYGQFSLQFSYRV